MFKIANTEVMNFDGAIRGMRNAMNSWGKADSARQADGSFRIGPNDMELAQKLISAGAPSHRKFLRQIFVSFDITAPIFFWKEFDTYKVATVRNSTSTMHKITSKPITRDCFTMESLEATNLTYYIDEFGQSVPFTDILIRMCEELRSKYLETGDVIYWKALIEMLPCGWEQMSTFTCNYETLRSMFFDRRFHKLSEWHIFCAWIKSLPYSAELITYVKEPEKAA